MKSGRPIDISKSSLVSLKAELSRKQDEIREAKTKESYIKLPPKPKKLPKQNPGVNERIEKDESLTETEIDALKKSREVLEIKSSLYEKLQKGSLVPDKNSEFLVDFKQKTIQNAEELEKNNTPITASENDFGDDYDSDSDSEWVEYVDCLGRTRKCLREDLESAKRRDEKLATSLYGVEEVPPPEPPPDLLASQAHSEMLRQKWDLKQKENIEKDKVFYEDVLFDEARTHGVSYFKFSTDEGKREEEQATLRVVREETEKRQEEARALRERRERHKQARLMAARQRQRARLNLPPIPLPEETEEQQGGEPDTKVEEQTDTKETLDASPNRTAHVRPWDKGKLLPKPGEQKGGKGESTFEDDPEIKMLNAKVRPWDKGKQQQKPALSQEEWIDLKRSERPSEFAPVYKREAEENAKGKEGSAEKRRKTVVQNEPKYPSSFGLQKTPTPLVQESVSLTNDWKVRQREARGVTSKEPTQGVNTSLRLVGYGLSSGPEPPEEDEQLEPSVSRIGAQIPPPLNFEYYLNTSYKKREVSKVSTSETEKAIEAGLNFLRYQVEQKEKSKKKGLLDIM